MGSLPAFLQACGFVPNLCGLQEELPRVIDGVQGLIDAIAVRDSELSREQKNYLLWVVANAQGSRGRRPLHAGTGPYEQEENPALHEFAYKLSMHAASVCRADLEALRTSGFDDPFIFETVLTIALGQLLCTLAAALSPNLAHGPATPASIRSAVLPEPGEQFEATGPYLQPVLRPASDFPPYAFFRQHFGFVPNLFKEQIRRPDVIEAETQVLAQVLIPEDMLSRVEKERIILVISAANRNRYFVTLHSQILAALGESLEGSDQIVEDHRCAAISPVEVALLDEVRKLACCSVGADVAYDPEQLRAHGFSESQIMEAVTTAAVANFLNTLQAGLGPAPDFPARGSFTRKHSLPSSSPTDLRSDVTPPCDPDAALVGRAQGGDAEAFEELVRRHSGRIFATLAGLLGNVDDARDTTQDVFLKAFEHMGRFQGRSKFSTWLTSIAINTGTELLRQRKPSESLDEGEEDDEFRPRQIQSWVDNPEQLLTASQRTELVREGVLRLPQKYRVVVLLRDINQLSTEEVAAALDLSIPAVKARLLRGRLMLRESLAPYFARAET